MTLRLAVATLLLLIFAIPSEAGFFSLRRKPRQPRQQPKAAHYGMSKEQRSSQIAKARAKAEKTRAKQQRARR
jgi:hypothetical protein